MVTLRTLQGPLPQANTTQTSHTETTADWWHELLWVPIAGVIGFVMTATMSLWLELSRGWIVAIYAPVVFALFATYVKANRIDLLAIIASRWRWGVGIGFLFGALLILTVRGQDPSSRPEGWDLALDVVWFGVIYGAADALLMNILPVLAVWRVFSKLGWTKRLRGKIGVGSLALVASMIVTVAYHVGFKEYQGTDINQPIIGNTINTLSFILTNNPIASLISHITMHIAAVFHGAETTVQLPPHY